MIKILVCFKITHEVEHLAPKELKAICEGTEDLEYIPKIIGSFDEAALEAALRLRDMAIEQGVEINLTALTIGKYESRFLIDIYSIKYDKVVHLPYNDDVSFCPERVAGAIYDYVSATGSFDIIITGQQASVGENAQTPYIVAERLGLPCISNVSAIELSGEKIKVTFKTNNGYGTALIKAPAIYAMGNAVHPYLRVSTLRDKRTSASKKITQFCASDFSPRMGEAKLLKLFFQEVEKKCTFIQGNTTQEKIRILWEQYIKEVGVI